MTDAAGRPVDYEPNDARPRLIMWLAVGIAVFLVAVPFILQAAYSGRSHPALIVGPL